MSRRFQYVEVCANGDIIDPGAEPYLDYEPLPTEQRPVVDVLDTAWTDSGIDDTARAWAITKLATPHFDDVAALTGNRMQRTRAAVIERLDQEIRYWDARAAELKQRELHGKKTNLNSGRARQRADDLAARKERRLRELALEADLVSHAPNVVAAALVLPQGLIDEMTGGQVVEIDPEVARDTDRRAVAAVLAAERGLGRHPVEQDHNNPGFDVLSEDPSTGVIYQIEVKGHRPQNPEIKVSAKQVRQAKQNPDRFRLAVVHVPIEPDGEPTVRYLIRPFDTYELYFAQTYVPLNVNDLMPYAVEPK